jgi:hypothetical protein
MRFKNVKDAKGEKRCTARKIRGGAEKFAEV